MQRPFIIEAENFVIWPYLIKPIKGFKYSQNAETKKKYPYCCKHHSDRKIQLKKWFIKFPNCCDHHKEIASKWHFEKKKYNGVVNDILEKLAYTEFVIGTKINDEKWFEKISHYIEYAEQSFGHPGMGVGKYREYLILYIENAIPQIPHEKQVQLIGLLKGDGKEDAEEYDAKLLLEIYEKWLSAFPFELKTYFGDLKDYFTHSLPILGSEVEVNIYSGYAKAKLLTKDQFIDYLVNLTDGLLKNYNAYELHKKGLIADAGKLKLEVAENKRKQKLQQGYFVKDKNDMNDFHKAIDEWFSDELEYLNVLGEQLKDCEPPAKEPETVFEKEETDKEIKRSELMHENLGKYPFYDLPKVNFLSPQSQVKLIELISTKGMPYAIAMFAYLGFLECLQREYFPTKTKLHKEISIWFGSDKDGRNVKGNINVLNPISEENRTKFTAHLHKENVEKDYESLK